MTRPALSLAPTEPGQPYDLFGEESATFRPGEIVAGNYEVRSLLGEGGMAQVWEAKDLTLQRRVALKVALPDAPPSLRGEARALAAFQHPSLVTVHCIAEHKGREMIVMERIYGISLAAQIDQRGRAGVPFRVEEVLGPLINIAEGLAVVHRAGIAHRDVKPDNIMLTASRRVVLMDFGLVLPEFEVASQECVAGSPPYMAPEALSNDVSVGRGQLVDIYSLGIIAFEMLVGFRPFHMANGIMELWEMHESGLLPGVSDFRQDVPASLVEFIAELMAKNPSARPQSAEGVAWHLRRLLAEASRSDISQSTQLEIVGVEVLLVEDDTDLARVMSFYVKQILGPETVIRLAVDGEEAVKELRHYPPDLLLLDLHMPKMNGVEVCMHMRGERIAEDTQIVAVSAGAQKHDLQLLHQLGIYRFIEKGKDLRKNLTDALTSLFL